MSRKCDVCGKGPLVGNTVARRGLARKKKGAGRKITGITRVWRHPNLREIKVTIGKQVKRIKICTKCLKKGDYEKKLLKASAA